MCEMSEGEGRRTNVNNQQTKYHHSTLDATDIRLFGFWHFAEGLLENFVYLIRSIRYACSLCKVIYKVAFEPLPAQCG